jgi:hypothetical protein
VIGPVATNEHSKIYAVRVIAMTKTGVNSVVRPATAAETGVHNVVRPVAAPEAGVHSMVGPVTASVCLKFRRSNAPHSKECDRIRLIGLNLLNFSLRARGQAVRFDYVP